MFLHGQLLAACAKKVVMTPWRGQAKDRGSVVFKKSKRSADLDTDRNATQAGWKKPNERPGRNCLTRRLAQCELANCDRHNRDKRVMSGKGRLPASCSTSRR